MISEARKRERDEALAKLGPRPPWYRPRLRRRWDRRRATIMAMGIDEVHERLAEIYGPNAIVEMTMRPNPAFSFLKKQPPGTVYVTPIKYEDK